MKKVGIRKFKHIVDKQNESEEFFRSILFKFADKKMLQIIINKKQEFIDWLNLSNLNYLISNICSVQPLSDLEWEYAKKILSILENFDFYITQCEQLIKMYQ